MSTIFSSCKKFVEVPPPGNALTNQAVFNTNSDAESAMAGMYSDMQESPLGGGPAGVSILPGLSADEVALVPSVINLQSQAYTNSLLSTNAPPFWIGIYSKIIYEANAAIAGVSASSGMTSEFKTQFLGESLFVRAYCYFYLVNFYGDVPLVTSTNYQVNEALTRTPKAQVYAQIVTDLKQAEGLLGIPYIDGGGQSSSERVRPNREAAAALLARTYLFTGDWKDAVTESSKVIQSGLYTLSDNLNQVFLASSTEAIWQLEVPVTSSENTQDGYSFLNFPLTAAANGGPSANAPYYLSTNLAKSFEPGDLRKANWVDSISFSGTTYYYPCKYKVFQASPPPTEYPMMLRYAEQFLILAEANAHLSNSPSAINNLNIIRNRAGLPNYTGPSDTTSVLSVIMHERRVELFTENGHRWFDLKRSGATNLNAVMGPACAAKGGTWTPNDQLYPIPTSEIQADPNLKQNPGY